MCPFNLNIKYIGDVEMIQVTKRDGRKQEFNSEKIVSSLEKCGLDELKSKTIALQVINELATDNNYEIEHIQNVVEKFLRKENKELQKKYHKYRQKRNNVRNFKKDMELLNITLNKNEYLKTENSNKNSQLVTTMRDYLAGEVSKDISKRVLLSEDVVKAHENGLIHFHDMDYFIQPMTNCCLINLKDMLDNGTVVNGKMIRSPHRFLTACTIATQIILAVSSSQYGGCTITISHLAPYLRKSKVAIEKKYRDSSLNLSEEQIEKLVETDLKNELRAGVQTFNYQVNSMANSNGQSPFITTFFYLSEDKEYTKEIAMITEEFLKQRLEGIENEQGVRVTQEFPKMIYVLEENNIHKDSKYYWLTELSAKCTAKRFVPDYVSEKVTKELKEGNCFPSMGL